MDEQTDETTRLSEELVDEKDGQIRWTDGRKNKIEKPMDRLVND